MKGIGYVKSGSLKGAQLRRAGVLVFGFAAVSTAWASGFGLYESSAKSYALGNATVGKAVDTSANFINPATLSDITNITVTAGVVTEHPRARMKVEGEPSTAMNPGVFWLPHFGLAVPLPWDFTFGFIAMPEYGLGSAYDDDWELVNSSQETTVQSFTLNPNISYAITEDWSVAGGARFFFFDFEQYSQPMPGYVFHRLKGDNGFTDVGWQVGTRYRILDNLAIGAVYKSKTIFNVEGKSQVDGLKESWVDASTDLEMPDSATVGLNWDITDTWHLGYAMTWTQWSTLDILNFDLGGQITPVELNWEDTYRFAIAPSWDFAEDWTWLASYVYETDCCGAQLSTMLPASDRHMFTTGLSWNCWRGLEITACYGLILMNGHSSQAEDYMGVVREYTPYRGITHAVGFSVTYRF